jgi:Protein of unknown function DUF47
MEPPQKPGRITRQEDAYFGLFQAAADTIGAAATVLLDLLSDLTDPETKTKQLAKLEHEGDRITRTILTRLASTFIARLDRDDIFELAERLDNVTDAIDMVFLHGITQPLDPVTEQAPVIAPSRWPGAGRGGRRAVAATGSRPARATGLHGSRAAAPPPKCFLGVVACPG